MSETWSEYFFMIGSSAAALIGLMFVVVTLTAGRERNELERGIKLYSTPIVRHLGVVLVLSGAAIAPVTTPRMLGVACLIVGAAGVAYGIRIAVGIVRSELAANFRGYDATWYGIAPAVAYLAIGGSGLAMLSGRSWAAAGIAAGLMALLLVSIHNEWDLVTYLAPDAQPTGAADARDKGP